MITVLIGHRGVGKTSLLKRLKTYFPDSFCFCLDEDIEKRFGSISAIFNSQGEEAFREMEKKIFHELYELAKTNAQSFIAVGAGFEGTIPPDCKVIWVQRAVDLSRFIFTNRPGLNADATNPLIPLEKFSARTSRYRSLATDEYFLLEGEYDTLPEEEAYFKNTLAVYGGCLTILSQHPKNLKHWNVDFFEMRDDLLSQEEIGTVIKLIPLEKRLFSFRNPKIIQHSLAHAALCAQIDWPVEFGEAPAALKSRIIYSHHGSLGSFAQDLKKMSSLNGPVKWSPLIESLGDLEKAHRWVEQDPQRSLLPRSESGKWQWYRLLQKGRQPLNFFREGEGSAVDQPSLIQWVQRDTRHKNFAAILGSPVAHSWTPWFHREFFKMKNMDVLAIDASEKELNDGGLEFLQELGFKAFAVTSPLKEWAAHIAGEEKPLNTLAWDPIAKTWQAMNTDKLGFLALVQQAEILFTRGKNTVIWGGRGVLPVLREVLPFACLYAAQTGRPRSENAIVENPDTLVWAGGDSIQKITSCHPHWSPKRVVDLSYRGDSAGIAYAKATGARYYSGKEMFYAQAEKQQKFWSDYEWK